MYRETPQKDLVRYNQPKLPFLCSWFGHKATTNGFFTTYLMNVYDYDYNKTISKVLGFSTVCEKCGINFIQPVNFSDISKCKNYFDQYYSFSETKWKPTSKKRNEVMIVGYVPTRRASNLITFIYCVWKKMIKNFVK